MDLCVLKECARNKSSVLHVNVILSWNMKLLIARVPSSSYCVAVLVGIEEILNVTSFCNIEVCDCGI